MELVRDAMTPGFELKVVLVIAQCQRLSLGAFRRSTSGPGLLKPQRGLRPSGLNKMARVPISKSADEKRKVEDWGTCHLFRIGACYPQQLRRKTARREASIKGAPREMSSMTRSSCEEVSSATISTEEGRLETRRSSAVRSIGADEVPSAPNLGAPWS